MPYQFSPKALVKAMESRGLKDADLADLLTKLLRRRISPTSVHQWRHGHHTPSANMVANLGSALQVRDLWFFYEDGDLAA